MSQGAVFALDDVSPATQGAEDVRHIAKEAFTFFRPALAIHHASLCKRFDVLRPMTRPNENAQIGSNTGRISDPNWVSEPNSVLPLRKMRPSCSPAQRRRSTAYLTIDALLAQLHLSLVVDIFARRATSSNTISSSTLS